MNEAMKPKLLWRPQDTGDVGAVSHQWKESAGMGRSWPKRELYGLPEAELKGQAYSGL